MSWDGYQSESGNYVEIEKGNLVRAGETIEIYDYDEGYKYVEVYDVDRIGSTVYIEAYDYNSGEFINLEMWDR